MRLQSFIIVHYQLIILQELKFVHMSHLTMAINIWILKYHILYICKQIWQRSKTEQWDGRVITWDFTWLRSLTKPDYHLEYFLNKHLRLLTKAQNLLWTNIYPMNTRIFIQIVSLKLYLHIPACECSFGKLF